MKRDDAEKRLANLIIPLQDFTGAAFPGYVDPNSLKYIKSGDVQVTFIIPREYRQAAVELAGAFGFPLLVMVEKWTNPEQTLLPS